MIKQATGELFIGVFSLVDSLRNLTLDQYVRSINEAPTDNSKSYYFWLYDYVNKKLFNKNNKEHWSINKSFKPEGHYQNILRHQLYIGIESNPKALKQEIRDIENRYTESKRFSFFMIFLISSLLLALITLFLGFIKKSFSTYNNQLEVLIKEQINYMSQTIDDFRDFHKPSKSTEPFDIKGAIKSAISILHVDKNITINLKGTQLYIDGYANEFQQAILNILSNAKDAIGTKEGVIDR